MARQHHDPLFLSWHRAHPCSPELALQPEIPGVIMP
jgi:hypothetical protein